MFMKKLIIALSLLSLAACTKKTSTTSSTSTALNSTETQLVGTWHLQKEVMQGTYFKIYTGTYGDTTYTGYNSTYFLTLTTTMLSGSKSGTESFNPAPMAPLPAGVSNSATVLWNYSTSTSLFTMSSWTFAIDNLTSSSLVLKQSSGIGYNFYYFTK